MILVQKILRPLLFLADMYYNVLHSTHFLHKRDESCAYFSENKKLHFLSECSVSSVFKDKTNLLKISCSFI